ncbi:MAG TPA: UbiA family prenyltransferase [Herpetosiphonaceae bacterium]|nr:UbiA family prenyltransferase [Herpetosiphonaceae bacterium]
MAQASLRHYARIIRHFASTRAPEVLALQASPLLGGCFGGLVLERWSLIRLGILLAGSLALTAHIFVFNDWAGYSSDLRDPRRTARVFARQGISRREVAHVAIALLVAAYVAFAALGGLAVALGTGIMALSLLYSCSPRFGKGAPIMGSINHLLGGALHFLLGASVAHALDARALVSSLFFGLVFAGGHLNQEVRDYEGDLLNGICTNAVVFGRERAFLASLGMFTAAYALLAGLAARGILAGLLIWSPFAWLLHAAWFVRALRRGLEFETALWMQRRYRLLFALIGLAMLVR